MICIIRADDLYQWGGRCLLLTPQHPPGTRRPCGTAIFSRLRAAQAAALRDLLAALDTPADLSVLAAAFEGKITSKCRSDIQRVLETLAALGQALEVEGSGGRCEDGMNCPALCFNTPPYPPRRGPI